MQQATINCGGKVIPHNTVRWRVATNRHPNTDGTSWGWIEGAPVNLCWSNSSSAFNREKAGKAAAEHNHWLDEQKPIELRIIEATNPAHHSPASQGFFTTTKGASMAKHQIKHRWNDTVLFECEVPNDMASGLRTRHALEQATKSGAYLSDANLSGANLSGANLSDAYLSDANLSGAYLSDANLSGANLSGAYLSDAYLSGANLSGANLSGANLSGAKWCDGVVINKPPIQLFGLHWRVTILDEHMQIGCKLHKLSDWAIYDDARIAAMDGREALRFWRSHKDVLLGLAKSAGRGVTEAPPADQTPQPA